MAEFATLFEELTGNRPLSWQTRLYDEWLSQGRVPQVIDLPTGLGKTMVMAIWLIARINHPDKIPTRLIYVVDRRTVVDQATELATKLRDKYGKAKLAISTLRGQLADKREWSRDPSHPAIIIGTVDLIGSALLFSGYRSSFKRRPLEAGLLGQDSLLVLDEAHLSKPFEKLIKSISEFQCNQGKPMSVIRMSATSGETGDKNDTFKLQFNDSGNLTGEDAKDSIITERFGASKRLTIKMLGEKDKLIDKLADAAIKLAENNAPIGKRIVVFVRKPEDAKTIAKTIREYVSEKLDESAMKIKKIPYANSVEVLTGTMRGLERDELIKKPVLKRFLDGNEKPGENDSEVFLISTSAGEVGFDLNADHLVGDTAPLDSWIQRLGRVNRRGTGDVNRRGTGDAQVHLFIEAAKKEKEGKPKKLEGFELAISNSVALLSGIAKGDVSPKNIAALKASNEWKGRDEHGKSVYERACSPEPTMVELTDILLDAWSMTSIIEPMPGRPAVAPWLRGIAEYDPPETTIAWREELDLDGFNQLEIETLVEWYDTHRILTHETLSVPTSVAAKWFIDRWNELADDVKISLIEKLVIIDRAGIESVTVKELIDQLSRKSGDNTSVIRNANLILPASFGGIERGVGLLDPSAPVNPKDANNVDAGTRSQNARVRTKTPDVADARGRYREYITKSEEGDPDPITIGSGIKPANLRTHVRFKIDLESEDDKRVMLVSYVPRPDKPEYGTSNPESLASHVRKVRNAVDSLLEKLPGVPDSFIHAAQYAADYHDHGKNRERWQRCVNGIATPAGVAWTDHTLGKSGGEMKRDPRGYRHEFGSLHEFTDAFNAGKLLDDTGKPISQEVFDLAMHLIAAHHGRGRPHFPKGGFDPDCKSRTDEIHTDAIRRFARLQRNYGHWQLAWLENLLRCADALASASSDADSADESEGVPNA